MGDSFKSLAEIKVHNVHSPHLHKPLLDMKTYEKLPPFSLWVMTFPLAHFDP